MSIAIIGGNECMERRYKDLCKDFRFEAKVFTKPKGIKQRLGSPDFIIFFTNTMSHKMIQTTMSSIDISNVQIVRSHSSSISSLKDILTQYAASTKTRVM